MKLKKFAVVGAGTMGPGIAQKFAQGGYQTSIMDIKEEALEEAKRRIRNNLELLAEKGILNEPEEKVLSRIKETTILKDAVEDADYVTEAVPEDLETKREVFKKLDEFCSKNTVLASNSSGSINVDEISSLVEHRERCLITHWVNPPHIMRLVEIVPGSETSKKVIQAVEKLLKELGKKPIICDKFEPGLINNTLQSALMRSAYRLVEKGVVDIENVDTVVKEGFGSRLATVGPFEFADMAGLDILLQYMKTVYERTGDETYKPPEILESKVKNGDGIYDKEDDLETEREINSSLIDQFKALGRME